ncbi:unnamed protein product [Clonostachys rhizophaga]|uniref:ferric-chelate reductase (NADPH) n=1 Tax=Clonostachys rhizophaga TaxID=160324 RepID=A0A9N9VEW7_9HYPO|nr:unnamed protein product [Clonostachys rhizophaga]
MPMLPWLTEPIMFHGDRDRGECMMTEEQCAWKWRWWTDWYSADLVFSLPTVAFFMVAIGIFIIAYVLSAILPTSWRRSRGWRRLLSGTRFLSYTSFHVRGWSTPSIGICLLGAVGLVYFLAMTLGPKPYYWPNTKELSYGNSPPIATRTGYMALACMPFLYVLGTKANFISLVTGISHEKLNVFHNWVAWAMFVLALVHTFPFIIYHEWAGDIVENWEADGMWITGVIALIAQAWLTFMSIRSIRDRYYEFFKSTHIFFAVVFFIFFFLHCDYILTTWDYFVATGVLYALSWLYSLSRTLFQYGFRHRASLSLDAEQNLSITIETDAEWKPGQHVFLRFLTCGVHALTAHPFTICSSPERTSADDKRKMIFHVKPRGGLTSRLAKLAEKQPNASVAVLLDGPYGGLPVRWGEGFDRTLVIGGGAGAGTTLPLIESYLQKELQGKKDEQFTAIVASRDPAFHSWFVQALEELATRYSISKGVPGLTVLIHQTDDSAIAVDASSVSNTEDAEKKVHSHATPEDGTASLVADLFGVHLKKGRPNLPALARVPLQEKGVTVGLVVCGPSSMVQDVSVVASEAQRGILNGSVAAAEVWFHKESFS